ncbi:MAG: lamin tail domain-containing protein [Candidatus Micrarchaeia archaeon]
MERKLIGVVILFAIILAGCTTPQTRNTEIQITETPTIVIIPTGPQITTAPITASIVTITPQPVSTPAPIVVSTPTSPSPIITASLTPTLSPSPIPSPTTPSPSPTPTPTLEPTPTPSPVPNGAITLCEVNYQSPEGSPYNESITICNNVQQPINITNWKLTDGEGNYLLPQNTILEPQTNLTVHGYEYNPTNYTQGLWLNNQGDEITLYDTQTRQIDEKYW